MRRMHYINTIFIFTIVIGCGSAPQNTSEDDKSSGQTPFTNPQASNTGYDNAADFDSAANKPINSGSYSGRQPTNNATQLGLQPFYNFGQSQQQDVTVPLVGGLFSFFSSLFGFGGTGYNNYGSQGYYSNQNNRPPPYYPGSGYQGNYSDQLRMVEAFGNSNCSGYPISQLRFDNGQSRYGQQTCDQYRYSNQYVGSIRVNGGYCENLVRSDTLGNIGNGLQTNPNFYSNSGWSLFQVCSRLFQ